jgi:hypothetical protein
MCALSDRLGVDLDADIIRALGGKWNLYVPAQVLTADQPRMLNLALTIELTSPDRFAPALYWLLMAPGIEGAEPVEFMGRLIYPVPVPGLTDPRVAFRVAPHLVVLDDSLMMATNLELAKTIVENQGRDQSPLLADGTFAALRAHVDFEPDAVFFEDRRLISEIRLASRENPLAEIGLTFPGPEVLDKYRSEAIVGMKWNDDGLLINGWRPHPGTKEQKAEPMDAARP